MGWGILLFIAIVIATYDWWRKHQRGHTESARMAFVLAVVLVIMSIAVIGIFGGLAAFLTTLLLLVAVGIFIAVIQSNHRNVHR